MCDILAFFKSKTNRPFFFGFFSFVHLFFPVFSSFLCNVAASARQMAPEA